MNKVVIYTKATCPYCVMAKSLLKQKGVDKVEEIRVDLDENQLELMIERTGHRTVPQIYINETHVGGFDDLSKLNSAGQLDKLLNQ